VKEERPRRGPHLRAKEWSKSSVRQGAAQRRSSATEANVILSLRRILNFAADNVGSFVVPPQDDMAPVGHKAVTVRRSAGDTSPSELWIMKIVVVSVQWLIRVLAVVQVTMGVLFWTGNAYTLIGLHMLSGIALVVALWIQAAIAARAGIGFGLPAVAFVWGILAVGLGLTQDSLLTGDLHWLIKVLHLLVGVGAVGQAESLAVRTLRRRQVSAPSPRAAAPQH
jgi:hypothetical protein